MFRFFGLFFWFFCSFGSLLNCLLFDFSFFFFLFFLPSYILFNYFFLIWFILLQFVDFLLFLGFLFVLFGSILHLFLEYLLRGNRLNLVLFGTDLQGERISRILIPQEGNGIPGMLFQPEMEVLLFFLLLAVEVMRKLRHQPFHRIGAVFGQLGEFYAGREGHAVAFDLPFLEHLDVFVQGGLRNHRCFSGR